MEEDYITNDPKKESGKNSKEARETDFNVHNLPNVKKFHKLVGGITSLWSH